MPVKRILVGLGLEGCSETATRHALDLSKRYDAELTGVTLIDTPALSHVGTAPIGGGAYGHQLSEERAATAHRLVARLEKQFRAACTAHRARFDLRCEEGDPIERLISVARYHDLAVVGRDGLCEHGVIDEPPDGLVRLVGAGVRPMIVAPPVYREIRRVLVAYSGSMESAKTLRRFIQMRPWPDAELKIVHFSANPPEGEQLLADVAYYCQSHGVQAQTELRSDSSRQGLLPVANQWDADLIVMGNSARRLMLRRLFGDTILQVVRESELALFLGQ